MPVQLEPHESYCEQTSGECSAGLKHKQSNAIEECKAEMRQTSLEATEAIYHLEEDTIVSITSAELRNVRTAMQNA